MLPYKHKMSIIDRHLRCRKAKERLEEGWPLWQALGEYHLTSRDWTNYKNLIDARKKRLGRGKDLGPRTGTVSGAAQDSSRQDSGAGAPPPEDSPARKAGDEKHSLLHGAAQEVAHRGGVLGDPVRVEARRGLRRGTGDSKDDRKKKQGAKQGGER